MLKSEKPHEMNPKHFQRPMEEHSPDGKFSHANIFFTCCNQFFFVSPSNCHTFSKQFFSLFLACIQFISVFIASGNNLFQNFHRPRQKNNGPSLSEGNTFC